MQWFEYKFKTENRPCYIKGTDIENATKLLWEREKKSSSRNKPKSEDLEYIKPTHKKPVEEVAEMFTKNANYSVDVSWIDIEDHLERMNHADTPLELDPDYQRGHVWTVEQQAAFVEFRLRGGMTGGDIYFNCPSWNEDRGEGRFNNAIELVDGKQRLNAVRKFMSGDLVIFGDKTVNDFIYIDRVVHRFRFHTNDLATRKEVLKWYLDFNSGGVVHTQEELNRVKTLMEKE